MLFEKFKQPNQGTEKKKTFEMHVFKEDLGASFLLIHKKKFAAPIHFLKVQQFPSIIMRRSLS